MLSMIILDPPIAFLLISKLGSVAKVRAPLFNPRLFIDYLEITSTLDHLFSDSLLKSDRIDVSKKRSSMIIALIMIYKLRITFIIPFAGQVRNDKTRIAQS